MLSDTEGQSRRLPSLVTYCQRILSTYTDSISSLGDDHIRYDVIKPVLECCSADTLLRLEQSSPFLENDTSEIWQRLCRKAFPLLSEQYLQEGSETPKSGREQYFLLQEVEAQRLELLGSRLRSQRMEADERKREREVKITDRLPPPKRARGWGASSQPKTLFQKTKSEATRLRSSMFTSRILPPPKRQRMPHSSSSLTGPAPGPSKPTKSLVTVKTVTYKRPSIPSAPPQSSGPPPTLSASAPVTPQKPAATARPLKPSETVQSSPTKGEQRPLKSPINKKDPMTSLFMPKHRMLSQLPAQTSNPRDLPTR